MEITFIINSGFIFATNSQRVLIDGITFPNLQDYGTIDHDIHGKMKYGESPFDLDVILVTHFHFDHFDPKTVGENLVHNNHTYFASSAQVVDFLKTNSYHYPEIEAQIEQFTFGEQKIDKLQIADISIIALLLHHSPDIESIEEGNLDRHKNVHNLAFIVKLGNRRVFHAGDSSLNGNNASIYGNFFNNYKKVIDYAVVPIWWLFQYKEYQFLIQTIKPRFIIPMHITNSKFYEQKLLSEQRFLPNIIFFEKSMETKEIN